MKKMKEPTDSWNIMNGVNIVWDQALSFGLAIVNIHVVIFCVEVFARPWCVAVSAAPCGLLVPTQGLIL